MTTGFYKDDIELPLPNIYISPDPSDDSYNKRIQRHSYISNNSQHFYIVLTVHKHYTDEDIQNCNGKYKCYNCQRNIQKRMYFYPMKQNHQDIMIMNPIPHCRPECVYRTVQDLPNSEHVLSLFFLFYGPDVICAPPRHLLFVPGGFTIEEYHNVIDNNLVVHQEEEGFRMCFSPLFVSCTLFKNHQIPDDIVSFIDEMNQEKKETIGPNKEHLEIDKMNIIPIKKIPLREAYPSTIFQIDPNSFNENGKPSTNPHL
jgi:hypothetical protein